MNMNMKDLIYLSVEEYNKTISNPKKKDLYDRMSDEEKKGMFYNALRRNMGRTYTGFIRMDYLKITLRENGEVNTIAVQNGYSPWSQSYVADMNTIFKNRKQFESSAIKNEIADIVQSIKLS